MFRFLTILMIPSFAVAGDTYLTPYCGVTHLSSDKFHEQPQCLGADYLRKDGWGITGLDFTNSMKERTTYIGLMKVYDLHENFAVGITGGYLLRGYHAGLMALPFVRVKYNIIALDVSYAPVNGSPVVIAIKFRF